jgi:CRP-like cAMP-binding protein/SAM-dependent methyltransferase
MAFLDELGADYHTLFKGAAEPLRLERGQHLIRRGEPGGDIFLIETGTLEVVDSRSTPEVILAVLKEGTVVGEMAFVNNSPRSADVRCATDSSILRWARDDLRALLGRNPSFAAAFFEGVARVASNRIRELTTTAVSGGITQADNPNRAGLASVQNETRVIAEQAKEGFINAETALRQNPQSERAQAEVINVLNALIKDVNDLFGSHPEPDVADSAARLLNRELHPYLVRSSLAERCIRRPLGVVGTADILAHVLVDTAAGDGQLGEILDRWLLDRPSLAALRNLQRPIVQLTAQCLPTHRNRRVLLVNAGTGSLVAGLVPALAEVPTTLTVVDQSREALAFLDAGVTHRPRAVDLQTVQENLAQFSMGRYRHSFPKQDAVILHGLIEYMPDRLAVSLLTAARKLLSEDGTVIVAGLGPSDDRILLDRLLTWPTIRRSRDNFFGSVQAGGLVVLEEPEVEAPALLVAARPAENAVTGLFRYIPEHRR